MMLLPNIITITLLLLSFPYLFGAFKVLPTGKVLTSSKLFLFGNPEPSKDAAPAKKDGGLFGKEKMIESLFLYTFILIMSNVIVSDRGHSR